jgi:hypothetical protein
MTVGGDSAHSASTYKSDGENAWYVTPKNGAGYNSDWVSGETIDFRARFANGTIASNVYSRSNPNYYTTFHYGYSDSTPAYGIYYRLYASKPYYSPAGYCNLGGTWCP